jgi:hypothetical protein
MEYWENRRTEEWNDGTLEHWRNRTNENKILEKWKNGRAEGFRADHRQALTGAGITK